MYLFKTPQQDQSHPLNSSYGSMATQCLSPVTIRTTSGHHGALPFWGFSQVKSANKKNMRSKFPCKIFLSVLRTWSITFKLWLWTAIAILVKFSLSLLMLKISFVTFTVWMRQSLRKDHKMTSKTIGQVSTSIEYFINWIARLVLQPS